MEVALLACRFGPSASRGRMAGCMRDTKSLAFHFAMVEFGQKKIAVRDKGDIRCEDNRRPSGRVCRPVDRMKTASPLMFRKGMPALYCKWMSGRWFAGKDDSKSLLPSTPECS